MCLLWVFNKLCGSLAVCSSFIHVLNIIAYFANLITSFLSSWWANYIPAVQMRCRQLTSSPLFVGADYIRLRIPCMAKYQRSKILANGNQFTKIEHNQILLLKYLECRADVICQFFIAKSLVSINFPEILPIFRYIRYVCTCTLWND